MLLLLWVVVNLADVAIGSVLKLKVLLLPELVLLLLLWFAVMLLLTQLLLWSMVRQGTSGWWVSHRRVPPGFVMSEKINAISFPQRVTSKLNL